MVNVDSDECIVFVADKFIFKSYLRIFVTIKPDELGWIFEKS